MPKKLLEPPVDPSEHLTFKQRRSCALRREESLNIKKKYPEKIPVIVERYRREKFLPKLDKCKFLVPKEMTYLQFMQLLRGKMQLKSTQAFYLLVGKRKMPNHSSTLAEVYSDCAESDGFMYVVYASTEILG